MRTSSRPRLCNAEKRAISKLRMLGWPACSLWKREKSIALPGISLLLSSLGTIIYELY